VAFFGTPCLALLALGFFSLVCFVTIFLHWLFGSIGICLVSPTFESSQLSSAKVVGICDRYFGSTCSSRDDLWVAGHRLHHAYTEDEDKDPIPPSVVFVEPYAVDLYPRPEFFEAETTKDLHLN